MAQSGTGTGVVMLVGIGATGLALWYFGKKSAAHEVVEPEPGMATVVGTVYSEGGAGLGGATVAMGNRSVSTDGDGWFIIENIAPADYTLIISIDGYGQFAASVHIVEGVNDLGQISMVEIGTNASLSGIVQSNVTALPVAGAIVSMSGISDVTDASGEYLLVNIPTGPQTIEVLASGYQDFIYTGYEIQDGVNTLTIFINPI